MSEGLNLPYDRLKQLQNKAYINYEGMSLNNILIRLPKMYKKGQENLEKEDDSVAFVYFTRWLNAVKWIKSRDKKFYLQKIDNDQIKNVEQLIKTLSEKLEAKYSQNLKKTILDGKGSVDQMDLDILPSTNEKCKVFSDVTLKFPETPTDDPLNTEIEEFIPCNQLYQIMRKEDLRFLIIDIRPQSDYKMSQINTCKCINIPEDEISEGKAASHYEKDLAKNLKSRELFRTRGSRYVDILVLLDWKTKKESLSSSNPLNIFKETLLKWDPATKYKKIVILDGGYNEWLMRYPAHTTNPNVTISETVEANNDILEDFVLDSYPVWVNNDDENAIKKQSQIKSNFIKDKSIIQDSLDDRQLLNNFETKINSTISSTLSNNNINLSAEKTTGIYKSVYGETINRERNIPAKLLQQNIITKPIIDRSNKPTSLKTSDPNSKEVLRLMKELNESCREMEKLEQKIYDTETSLYNQNIKNKGFKEDSTIHTDLESMNSELNILQKIHNKNEKELNKYKEVGTIQFSNEDQEEKSKLDFNLHIVRQRLKDISGHRKRLHERSLEKDHKDISIKQNDKDIHMEPLKTDSSISSGLERSHSSPNLMQMRDHKAPEVDRSSKPQISSQYQHTRFNNETNRLQRFNWGSIEEKLTPIHGNVHPGITGLKNLGNSCYMNSIIQCLSNTPKLSTYFIDNLYADDLNRNNENVSQTQVVTNVAEVIKALWTGQYKRISPHCLKVAIGQYKLQFSSYEQQDSHEFLTFLLDWMHSELRKKVKIQVKMTTAEKEWDKAMDSQESIISELFFGQLRSTITCSSCQKDSTTYETFNSLTMSLPHTNRCTLDDCIQRFVTGQKVVGWKCPKCQAPREATKKFDFIKLAPIIVIHLNRFAESGGWLEKRNTTVDFPLKEFNLKPYLIIDHDAPMNNARFCTYNLYAMSNHYGTMEGGHYTAFCKNSVQNKWYKYDDQTVTEVSPSQVKSQNNSAYLLFYTSLSNTYI
ncbi:ubiquitin carboxyl-terminal hydrolase 8-like [Vespa mandarinia]|uniref:ubiquitin carboxyl-terminal hydrolase 8-like n=1 Tax=Vespa mandarinia TaxID=7446 RepID=UPI00160A19B3|nr:ubiquitin carboxyl-terminal hydrolase 8-like [Vespa mandarinia]XP_035723569.1 ubiquitin carboxyl-terminal hydrolase 8-like [Vespa mandarinia]